MLIDGLNDTTQGDQYFCFEIVCLHSVYQPPADACVVWIRLEIKGNDFHDKNFDFKVIFLKK